MCNLQVLALFDLTVCSLALNLFTIHYISRPLPSAMWAHRGTARGFDVVACLFRDLRDSGFLVAKNPS